RARAGAGATGVAGAAPSGAAGAGSGTVSGTGTGDGGASANRVRAGSRPLAGWPLEVSFLEVLIAHPELIEEAARTVEPAWFQSDEGRAIAERLLGPGRRDAQALLSDPELAAPVRERLSALLASARSVAKPERALTEGTARLKQRALEEERARIQSRMRMALREAGAREELVELQQRMQETAAALRAIASEARRKERA
ncbi:MAG: hypothetical protein ACREOU_09165, partial [Candidatus Eiseniibacteriota bacterium]